jgi:hypothetical protein
MADVAIDWASADVTDGRLTVAYTEKVSKDWTERLHAVLARLAPRGSGWGSIEVKKKKLRVDAVQPGAEADLRHLLDSAFLQTNAGTDDDSTDQAATSSRSESDQTLTDTFRGFSERSRVPPRGRLARIVDHRCLNPTRR